MSLKYPKVVVITLNYNQNQYTLDCIESLFKSDYPNFEILLIDNGSEQKNIIELEKNLLINKKIILKIIVQNRGYVGGINFGLAEAEKLRPDYFLIMNNDTIIGGNTISELIKTSQRYSDNAIVTGKTYDYGSNTIQYIGDSLVDERFLKYKRIGAGKEDKGQFDKDTERDMIDDIYWLVPQKVFQTVGYYSKLFWFNGESADYALRAVSNGFKLVFSHRAKMWHKGSISIGGRDRNPAKAYLVMQSKMLLRSIHLKKKHYFIFVFKAIVEIAATFSAQIYRSISGKSYNFEYPKAKFVGFLSVFKILRMKQNPGTNPFLQ